MRVTGCRWQTPMPQKCLSHSFNMIITNPEVAEAIQLFSQQWRREEEGGETKRGHVVFSLDLYFFVAILCIGSFKDEAVTKEGVIRCFCFMNTLIDFLASLYLAGFLCKSLSHNWFQSGMKGGCREKTLLHYSFPQLYCIWLFKCDSLNC